MKFSEFEPTVEEKIEQIKQDNPDKVGSVEEQLKKYENLSEQELMQEFLKESKKQKLNGQLNEQSLENIKQTLAPFLDSEQLNKLNNLLELI